MHHHVLRTYVFLRGCTPAAPLAEVGVLVFCFSLELVRSSLEVASDVEKCFEEGTRDRGGPAIVEAGAGA